MTENQQKFEPGGRYTGLRRVLERSRDFGRLHTRELLLSAAEDANEQMCDPPLPDGEVARIVDQVLRYRRTERIVAAAILQSGVIVSLQPPARHGDVMRQMSDYFFRPILPHDQGFLTSEGRFVSRRDAAEIAARAGQLAGELIPDAELCSEDLW